MDIESIHRICSSQVVVDLATAVKELVENSLDAGATVIEVKLKNMGADGIEVADNGHGIHPDDYTSIVQKHHTSKISRFEDLEGVLSFGFRGEALNALCELSGKFQIMTKRAEDKVGATLTFDKFGRYLAVFPDDRLLVILYFTGYLLSLSQPERMELLSWLKISLSPFLYEGVNLYGKFLLKVFGVS